MAVFRDISDPSILIGCTECPYWFAMRFTDAEAWTAAENHKINVHDVTPSVARNTRVQAEKRARLAVK